MIILLKFIASIVISTVLLIIIYCGMTLFAIILDFIDRHFPSITKYLDIILTILASAIIFFIFLLFV